MNKILPVILKGILILSLLLLIAILTFGLVIWMHWPWWVGVFFLIGACGLYLSWLFFSKILLRRREKNFIHQVIAQDDAYIKGQDSGQEGLLDLQNRWKEAIETLKSSHLNKHGNPLYVLPWYMVIGESRSGKSTAIQSAGLSGPFAETGRINGIAGTRNCEWWFLEQAIILDTAGRYTIPLEEGRDKEEWQQFLSQLVKYRKKEPLNGLVVTMAADKLLQADPETIADDGRNIRQRIEELMRVLGKVFPIYVLITKCDLIQGMTQFCEQLPEQSLNQAMGFLNQEKNKNINTFLDDTFLSINDRLQHLRLQLIHGNQAPGREQTVPAADLLLFPNEFKNLQDRLSTFIEITFKENPYQESSILRGLYFSSGRQEGTPYSHFLHALGLIKQQDVLPGTNRGFFLHDLFAHILPEDRFFSAPTQKALAWNRLTRNLGLTAWMALIIALCGLLSFSFVKNLATLRNGTEFFKQSITLQGDLLSDTAVTEHFQMAINRLEEDNDSWRIPRFGLHESEQVEFRLKQKYCRLYKNDFSREFDSTLDTVVSEYSPVTQASLTGPLVVHLARRINLIQTKLDKGTLSDISEMNQPSFQPLLSGKNIRHTSELSDRILQQYNYYLYWQNDRNELQQEKQKLQRHLHHMLNMQEISLDFLVSWTNNNAGLTALDLQDFWKAPLNQEEKVTVPPAFTTKGKEIIDTLLNDIETALPDPLLISTKKIRFRKWYNLAYEQVWYEFVSKFPQAEYYLAGNTAWQQTAKTMATDNSPYLVLLRTLAKELIPLETQNKKKDWVRLVEQIELVRKEAEREAVSKKNKSIFAKVTQKGKKALDSIEKKTGFDSGGLLTNQLLVGKIFNNYQEALKNIIPATSSRTVSYAMAAEVFTDDPVTSKSPFFIAQRHLNDLKIELGSSSREQQVVWRMLAGPLYFLRDYVYLEAACHLNGLWEKNVLVEIRDIQDKTRLKDELFSENGYAVRFIKGPADPFLRRNVKQGFYPKTAIGRMLPFEKDFLSFLTNGLRLAKFKLDPGSGGGNIPTTGQSESPVSSMQERENLIPLPPTIKSSYTVRVLTNPTSVNREAKITPHATTLELICGSETTRLVNQNYPKRKDFVWEPQKCQRVNLHINIGSLILTKKYEGKLSFAHFAKEFQKGSHHFTAKDFPEKKNHMTRMRIKDIKVNYQIKGGQALVDLLDQATKRASLPDVPQNITTCWDRRSR